MQKLSEPTVLIVRHGTTGKDEILKGLTDYPLNDTGRKVADRLGRHLSTLPISVINHSPLARGRETAEAIGKATGLTAKSVDALGPMDVGRLAGMDKDAARGWMRYYIEHPDKVPPGAKCSIGDWFEDFSNYLSHELAEAKRNPGKARVEVTHSSESVNIPSVICGGPIEYRGKGSPAPGSVARLSYRGGKWHMREEEVA